VFYISRVSPYTLAVESLEVDGLVKPDGINTRKWVLLNEKYILETMTGLKLELK
jgi:hypothetical protein